MDDSKFFTNELIHNLRYEVNFHLKFEVALDIIRHAALVSAKENGEDSSGRQQLMLLTAEQVAVRAADIAEHLVNNAVSRGWVKESTVTNETKARLTGKLRRLGYESEIDNKE